MTLLPQTTETTKSKRGFASMSHEQISQIGQKGGRARAVQLGADGYAIIGRKGGKIRAAQLGPAGYAAMGRKGGRARADLLGSEGYAAMGRTGGRVRAGEGTMAGKRDAI